MSKLQLLNAFLTERLTVAAVEIFGAVEEVIVEYQDEIYRSNEENERLQKLLDLVLKPEIKLHRADTGQITRFSVYEEEIHHDWSPGLGQSTHITEEQEPGTKTPSYVESKDSPQPLLHIDQIPPEEVSVMIIELIKTEADEKSHAVSEPTRDSHLLSTVDLAGGPLLSASMLDRNRTLVTVNPECSAAQSEKSYRCHICSRRFKVKGRLNVHLRLHTETPYHCNFCLKRFTKKCTLTVHVRIHTGERPYTCNICEKRFKQKNHLTDHIKTHTGERPYSCHVCGRHFTQCSNMVKHVKTTHKGERLNNCHVYGQQFTQSCQMTEHMKAKHKGLYRCNDCGECFTKIGSLGEHVATIHTGKT